METRAQRIRRLKSHSAIRSRIGGLIWNGLSILILLLTAGIVAAVVMIYQNPMNSLNPFPPPTLEPTLNVVIPTRTVTPILPTSDPTATFTPSPVPTDVPPAATATVTPLPTITDTPGPTPTATIYSAYNYIVDTTSIIGGETFHAGEGCKLWVAGQTLDIRRAPMVGITIQLGGYLDGVKSSLSLSGTALQYGQAGYEFTISDQAANSKQMLWVQLLDQSGVPLSARIFFDTYEDCQKNLILINFKQVK